MATEVELVKLLEDEFQGDDEAGDVVLVCYSPIKYAEKIAKALVGRISKPSTDALRINCDRCGEPITEQGALLFSPPENGMCKKEHICKRCFGKLLTDEEIEKILPAELIIPKKEWERMTEAQRAYVQGKNDYRRSAKLALKERKKSTENLPKESMESTERGEPR